MSFESKLSPSLISSFYLESSFATPLDLASDAFIWPSINRPLAADIYVMMESDVKPWADYFHLESASAFDLLAQIGDDQCQAIAAKIIENAKSRGVDVVALTSFLPEICIGQHNGSADNCVAAIESLLRIALYLGEQSAAHGSKCVPVVQMVAGSLIAGFQARHEESLGEKVLFAQRGDAAEMFHTILSRLSQSLRAVADSPRQWQHVDVAQDLRIAFELEPGPIYLLRTREMLEQFNLAIEDFRLPSNEHDELIQRCVGFNLDVAHWWLAQQITPEWLMTSAPDSLRKRIFHAHISGHSDKGHFGDMPLNRMPPEREAVFREWLRTLHQLDTVQHVSLEFEAANSLRDVSDSAETLVKWLAEIDAG